MNGHDCEKNLSEHGVKPTAVRMLVWQRIASVDGTFTMKDLEDCEPQMDRSSIFRALRLFVAHNLIHEINDGTGQCKYCVCRCEDESHRGHVHFTCTECGKTYCFDMTGIPKVNIPDGFRMDEAEYVIKGVCRNCMKNVREVRKYIK